MGAAAVDLKLATMSGVTLHNREPVACAGLVAAAQAGHHYRNDGRVPHTAG
jgi:hypothetical protein